ncbi:lys-63-specific deubiquitinase BRCC36-like isoform X3 [Amyelois transitella]|uniref:lys-63-specific deubiquitinase BRCC36-like isoform X3 n=1 Tax=Amyelois transitella TaxID=680683 RepID=UPI00067E49E9|nr:lys-63-specific deubiquitinase BRCC36-like isoform X3 [Amyelois transitella]
MLEKVVLSTDVALVCVQHALSTEKEEIMGLLIGEVHNNGSLVSIVSSVILRRLDKKPDRVEISEEQLVQATLRAEELAAEVDRPLRVVDLATQSMYQRMDSSFVGIIFAVFLTEQTTKAPSVQITCFQSINGSNQTRREIDMEITNSSDSLLINNFQILTQLPAILKEEEDEAYNNEVGQSDEQDDIINKQHNAAVRTIAIGHIVEKMSRPMLEGLVARNALNNVRVKALKKHHQELMSRLENSM